jgi:CheY-like chemotaxis protein/signal transduction histidine kinase/CHASE3 domain sensor protein
MLIIAGATYESINTLIESAALENQAHKMNSEISALNTLTIDMVAGTRGYALTGEDKYLKTYNDSETACYTVLSNLKELVKDPSQLFRLGEIEPLIKKWQKEAAQPIITARKEVNEGGAGADINKVIEIIKTDTGRELIEQLRMHFQKFLDNEDRIISQRQMNSNDSATRCLWVVFLGTIVAIVLGAIAMFQTTRSVLLQVGGEPATIAGIADQIAEGNLDVEFDSKQGTGTGIWTATEKMLLALRQNRDQSERQDWLKTGMARINSVVGGDPDIEVLTTKAMSEIATYLNAHIGALYLAEKGEKPNLTLAASYAYTKRKNLSNIVKYGEGIVGQAALEKQQILLKNVPEDYIKVTSGLGERIPRFICVTPFLYEGRVKGVIEIGTLNEMTDRELEYLSQAMPTLSIAVQSGESRTALSIALQESQQLTEELQTQQEELKVSNEELEEQTQKLSESEERLKVQQEELQVTNEELEEKNELLQRQTIEVEQARKDIQEKAEEVALASKYKSEFLANMSHELRTPLNSLLLLAHGLVQNKEGNLTSEQVESAQIIKDGGNDLLNLINEILDLSKIEAGRMDLQLEPIDLNELADTIRSSFQHMAKEKGLELDIILQQDSPTEVVGDRKRTEQVIRNLMSNALKFTETGGLTVTFGRAALKTNLSRSGLQPRDCIAIAVRDTGIGIPLDKQKIIFEAFQQADGGTARKYGGTGLGLSISREFAKLLGGEIHLESEPGKGSTFTLYLPLMLTREREVPSKFHGSVTVATGAGHNTGAGLTGLPSGTGLPTKAAIEALQIDDDREVLMNEDRLVLVVDDDPKFSRILYKMCHEKGFKCLAAPTGEAALILARKHLPGAILLDLHLPGMDGWAVLNALKEDTTTRHIPVHIISVEAASTEALNRGAIGQATKPIAPSALEEAFRKLTDISAGNPGSVLVVEDDDKVRERTVSLISGGNSIVDEASSGEEALAALRTKHYDCVVLDLSLPDMDGSEVLSRLEAEGVTLPPVIIHTARDLTNEEEFKLRKQAESIVIKDVRSPERLLDEVSLFLHRVVSKMPEKKRQIIRDLHDTDALLRDKKVLIVDDDMRTTFAMSRLLTDKGMIALKAENGERALRILEEEPQIDLVLMDIMMPVMDGYETMGRIRSQEKFRKLPIIALTAKAMPQDKLKCITAGANDYLPKPVDAGRLFSIMRVWLYR